MTPIRPYNVLSGDFAKRLDKTMRQLWGQGALPNSTERRGSQFFFSLRPIQITSDWIATDSGPYKARAQFLALNSEGAYTLQDSPTVDLYSPIDLSEEPTSASGDGGWAVYRGRWEFLASLASTSEEDSGHLVGTTASTITGPSATTTVAGKTVRCPLLANDETLTIGTSVVISRHLTSDAWEITWFRENSGHLTGTTASRITGPSATTTVAGKTVRCPLLANDATIQGGSFVVISRNLTTGAWEIIEAPCANG